MDKARVSPSQFVTVISETYTATQVDDVFAMLLYLWKTYGRRMSLREILSLQDHNECAYVLCYYLDRMHTHITIAILKKYRHIFRAIYDKSYIQVTTLWSEDIASLVGAWYYDNIDEEIPDADVQKKHKDSLVPGIKVTYDSAIYYRGVDKDVDALLKHII